MSKAPPPESAEGVYSSVTKAAEAMGIKPPQLHVWRKQNGFPGWDGHYPVEEILAWRETVRVGRPRGQTETKVDYSNELRRIRVEEKLGHLIEVETVEREIIRAYSSAVSELHLLCGRIERSRQYHTGGPEHLLRTART
jgi:hypothetical protein